MYFLVKYYVLYLIYSKFIKIEEHFHKEKETLSRYLHKILKEVCVRNRLHSRAGGSLSFVLLLKLPK